MFGDWGTLLLQFLITAVVVVALVGIVWWAARRYSSAGLGRLGRGRVPRLAIVDAMSVDGRRRLVLVRRDNVEHLIMIGGPSDLVVEQAIQRPRKPKAQAEGEPPADEAAPPPPPPQREPIRAVPTAQQAVAGTSNGNGAHAAAASERSFTFRRATPVSPPPSAPTQPSPEQPAPAAAARLIDFQRPTRIETPPPEPPAAAEEAPFPDLPTAESPADLPPAYAGNGARHPQPDDAQSAGAAAPSPFAKPDAQPGENRNKLADLENEMARLLGEITQKRQP